MNRGFELNQIRPDDPDFVFDKQVDFPQPSGVSEWDEDDDN